MNIYVLLLLLLRWCSDERKYTYPYSMMHRRLTTAGVEVAPHYHKSLVIVTPPSSTSSSGPHHERGAGPRCTAVTGCFVGGCDPSSVITASLFCCVVKCMCVRCVARAPRNVRIWIFGNSQMVTMPDFGFDGVSSSLAEFTSIFLFSNFFVVLCT